MPESNCSEAGNEPQSIGLLGASFDTGNLGVSALADASIKLLLERWPNSKIISVGGYEPKTTKAIIAAKQKKLTSIPVRFSKNIFHPCHFLRFFFYGLLKKGFKGVGNAHFKTLIDCEFICDITGGDSFSDIYGFKRFFLGFLTKWLFIFLGKDLVMLPQTYGPFKKRTTRKMATYLLKKSKRIYSRDRAGVGCVHQLLKGKNTAKVQLCPDVAFVLDPRLWDDKSVEAIDAAKRKGKTLVGLNINGLLYNGGYTRDNMFGLAVDYPKLIKQIIDYLLGKEGIALVLVPHVFPGKEISVESDPVACKAAYDSLTRQQQKKVFLSTAAPDQEQVKYLIGKCDFFVGSRMHTCIAALSQCIPAIGMAYSDKFIGVFETVGLGDCVVNMRTDSQQQVLDHIEQAFKDGENIQKHLNAVIPKAKQQVLSLFGNGEI